jgi:hypothetical protein
MMKWTSQPETVLVINGLFNFQLGSKENIPPSTFNDTSLWLGITVGTGPEVPEIEPRTRLVSAPYAFKAYKAEHAIYADTASHIVTTDTIYVGDVRIVPTTRYYSIPPAAFKGIDLPTHSTAALHRDPSSSPYFIAYVETNVSYPTASAPLNLPHGAVLNGVTAFAVGIATYNELQVAVDRISFGEQYGLETIGSAQGAGSSEDPSMISLTTFTDPVIDNATYTYSVLVRELAGSPEEFSLIGVRVEYTIESPLP